METKEKVKKSYIKPRVTKVKLEIQEAILANCKTASNAAGKTGSSPPQCRIVACAGPPYGS